jgi:disulfide bond formation protein DsbB
MGLTAYEAVIEGYSIEMVSQLSSFWVLMGVTLLGLERTGEWKPTKKVFAVLLVILALRSLFMYQSFDFFESIVSLPVDVKALLKPYCNVIFTFFWLWPLAVILTFVCLGTDKISAIAASISFLGMALGEILMTIFFVIFLRYGVTGVAFARGLAPIISILITIFASRTVKT